MKKLRRNIITLLLLLLVYGSLSSNMFAASIDMIDSNENDQIVSLFIDRIYCNLPEFSDWNNAVVYQRNVLYAPKGFDGNWLIYELNSNGSACGYVIIDVDSGEVVEFSSGISPFRQYLNQYMFEKYKDESIKIEKMLYYPGFYAVDVFEQNTGVAKTVNFTEDTSVEIKIKNISKMNENNEIGLNTTTKSTVLYKLISGVPDSPYYISCIPTAIGNLIGYWDTHLYSNLIVAPESIFSVISAVSNRMIATSGNNQNNAAIPDAIWYYCNSRYPNNFNTITNQWYPSFGSYMNEIDYNHPTLLGFNSSSYYGGAHMTCGVGYYWDLPYGNPYSIVHDAWSSTSVNCYQMWGSWNDFICKVTP